MSTVYANARVILSKGDNLQHVCAVPDVCKTPTPAGPVPIPYVNVAMNTNLVSGSQDVKIDGQSGAIASSKLSTSVGDEAGSAGGVVSSSTKGAMSWASSSPDVLIEGKGAVRFLDVTLHNNGGSPNAAFTAMGWPKP
jgi:hypothetical protein